MSRDHLLKVSMAFEAMKFKAKLGSQDLRDLVKEIKPELTEIIRQAFADGRKLVGACLREPFLLIQQTLGMEENETSPITPESFQKVTMACEAVLKGLEER